MAPNDLKLRAARPDDASSLWTIRTEAIRVGCANAYSPDQLAAWTAVTMPVGFIEAIKHSEFLVAELGGVPCGFGFMTPQNAEIDGIFVSPGSHRRGVGTQLLSHLEQHARSIGITRLTLNATLNAEAFYATNGYRVVERKLWRHPNGFELPSVLMEKLLDTN